MAEKTVPQSLPPNKFSVSLFTVRIATDTLKRFSRVTSRLETLLLAAISLLPTAKAFDDGTADFTPRKSNNTLVINDVKSIVDLFDFPSWKGRADSIRNGNNRAQCSGNLSLALQGLGPLYLVENSGASGALSLLPTAGALIGAPAKELWILYKLMPLAGVLSMLLSLGGNIVPMESSDYELKTNAFTYGGMIATSYESENTGLEEGKDPYGNESWGTDAEKFARTVELRANEHRGSRKRLVVFFGIFMQLFWIGVLLSACYLTESGSVVVWWCKAWGWMFFWYIMVALSSLLENFAGVPFTKQWTIRVSKSPRVRISSDAPLVAGPVTTAIIESQSLLAEPLGRQRSFPSKQRGSVGNHLTRSYTEESLNLNGSSTIDPATPLRPDVQNSRSFSETNGLANDLQQQQTQSDLLTDLTTGYNTTSRVIIDPNEPWAHPRVPFYVIISLEGITTSHAVLRVFSKAVSVGVFAAGTATFASAAMITISIALTVLCLVLGAGVFGRVVAMWLASEMMKSKPVLHRVAKKREDAAELIRAILNKPGLTCELMGHVIVDGRCVKRYNKWFRWSTIFGVLAPPFDITKLAARRKNL